MGSILKAFVSSISGLLADVFVDEVGMLLGIPGEIEKLRETVRDIQCVLSDAERKQTDSEAIESWLMELKDVMYDADNLIDDWQIKSEDCGSTSTVTWGVNLISSFSNTKFAHEIGTKIKQLNSRLEEISKKKSHLGLNELQDVVRPFKLRRRNFDMSHTTDPLVVLDDLVGDQIEEDAKLLVKWLTEEEKGVKENVSTVAVVGMPGIGKTTLAKRVFNDPRIQQGFDLKFWVCVSKDLKSVGLLKCIIREAGGDHNAAKERSELVPMLERLIRGKKFFLVLDDVWPESQNVWDGLLRGPMIGGACGSRLLVTTRDGKVARFMNAIVSHQVEKLSDKDAWSLIIKQVKINQTESEMLNDIGLELVKKCNGLPLAIKAIAGILLQRDKNRAEWQKISRSNLWSVGLLSDFHRAFYLSYEDLPSYLKQCFILCSLYPEDYEFGIQQLVYLWLAEGFLCDEGDLSFWELGIEYYNELISRNLLEANPKYYNQHRCKMHDLLKSFAECLGKGENLIMRERELSFRSQSLLKLRRLSLEEIIIDPDILKDEKSLRTLLLTNNLMGDVMSNMLLAFSYLRIIDLNQSNITSLSDSFCSLVHLRYLSASRTKLKALPNSIGNLRKLVYLSLTSCQQLSYVPSSICDLLDLRYLSLYDTKIDVFPEGLRKLEKLVDLYGFTPCKNNSNGFSSLEDLGTLYQISELCLDNLEKASDFIVAKEANLKHKIHLKDIVFSYTLKRGPQVCTIEEKKAAEDVLNELSPPPSLEYLVLKGYFGHQLPNWLHVGMDQSIFQFLRYLELDECECFSQLPPLGQLPNLDFLKIKCAISIKQIGREFFLDQSYSHIRTELGNSSILPFSQLNQLGFFGMLHWEIWSWEEGLPAMPKLKNLFIEDCPELSSLPKGLLHHATSLEFLQIRGAKQIRSVESLQSVKDIRFSDNPNLESISNLPNLSFIAIGCCPKLKTLENLKPHHRMNLWDFQMETLPKYLITVMPEKLTIWCSKELLLKITDLEVGKSERQKFEHIPAVKISLPDNSLYATYKKLPCSFTTNVPGKSSASAQ
ncbi:hypothetical protein LUZ61_014166 [Rhynchospora tenuis]|uniref:Disease resistance protein RGA3 n=1 Tax=Rhynchospora tenuis TaxID=198213 RepID=A0AAD5WA69_9POAL|nr:hypothetical protein LUZ61_014166 [Rhynchospora tenuis]